MLATDTWKKIKKAKKPSGSSLPLLWTKSPLLQSIIPYPTCTKNKQNHAAQLNNATTWTHFFLSFWEKGGMLFVHIWHRRWYDRCTDGHSIEQKKETKRNNKEEWRRISMCLSNCTTTSALLVIAAFTPASCLISLLSWMKWCNSSFESILKLNKHNTHIGQAQSMNEWMWTKN